MTKRHLEFAPLDPARRLNPVAPLDLHWLTLMRIYLEAQFGLIAPQKVKPPPVGGGFSV
jgi:hypothetical protein